MAWLNWITSSIRFAADTATTHHPLPKWENSHRRDVGPPSRMMAAECSAAHDQVP